MSGAAITQIGATVSASPTVVTLTTTGAGNWMVPVDYQNSIQGANGYASLIECYGGGGGTNTGGLNAGGGAAYSAQPNQALTVGASIPYSVGVAGTLAGAGGDSWMGNVTEGSAFVAAKGGGGNAGGAGTGGQAASGIGTTKNSGGSGASSSGGGGAAGPTGSGGNGTTPTGGAAGGGLAGTGGNHLANGNNYGGGAGQDNSFAHTGGQGVIVISYYTVS